MSVTGLPPGLMPEFFPNIDPERLIASIETQGARFAWKRALECPCVSNNSQTRQPDPVCPVCHGASVFYFGPDNYIPPEEVGQLTPLQRNIITVGKAPVIRGFISSVTRREDFYDLMGHWYWGTVKVTVRPENRLGFFDKLIGLDSEIVYYERVEVPAGSLTIPTRYPVIELNHVQTLTTALTEGVQFRNNVGALTWQPGYVPATSIMLAVHYTTYPVWQVIDYPHAYREAATRTPRRTTPLGTPRTLPIQAKMKLDFVPDGEVR